MTSVYPIGQGQKRWCFSCHRSAIQMIEAREPFILSLSFFSQVSFTAESLKFHSSLVGQSSHSRHTVSAQDPLYISGDGWEDLEVVL